MKDWFTEKLLDKRKKVKPKFQINDLIPVADLKKTFSKGVTLKWSDKLSKITEIINKTIGTYHIDNLPECYKELLLKKTELSMKENISVLKEIYLG